ncbi:MAG TPA: hypothetical protein DCM31_07365 [Deferribacteraceae bacterium]|nr:hypothetical protein [Deferribacteraceae bacterium]
MESIRASWLGMMKSLVRILSLKSQRREIRMSEVSIILDNENNTVCVVVKGSIPQSTEYHRFLTETANGLTRLTGRQWRIKMPSEGQLMSL